ncbi:hypothetical protein EVAR_82729_1 [Eumeta japonica]|uniref:Uncharacterized protein n=1 Tax=Eumeta variegata TaxID=151549 RepID=A0A4C1ZMZ3_EUMVA|nr:hypothetical protein EVAR_82729_1 [Eumeta japonica]
MLWVARLQHENEFARSASLLPNAIFYCGWHLNPVERIPQRDLRRLVVLSCARAQRPVVFRAFGVQELSYESYLSIPYSLKGLKTTSDSTRHILRKLPTVTSTRVQGALNNQHNLAKRAAVMQWSKSDENILKVATDHHR